MKELERRLRLLEEAADIREGREHYELTFADGHQEVMVDGLEFRHLWVGNYMRWLEYYDPRYAGIERRAPELVCVRNTDTGEVEDLQESAYLWASLPEEEKERRCEVTMAELVKNAGVKK